MATPCIILKVNSDGTCLESSIRSDGYLSGVGARLFKWYQDEAKIDQLFAQGWVSPLEANPEWHEGDTLDGEYPKHHGDKASALKATEGDTTFLWENGDWYWIDYKEISGRRAKKTVWTIETIEKIDSVMLIAHSPMTKQFLNSPDDPAPFWQTLREDFDKRASQNTDPNVEYSRNGNIFAVRVGKIKD